MLITYINIRNTMDLKYQNYITYYMIDQQVDQAGQTVKLKGCLQEEITGFNMEMQQMIMLSLQQALDAKAQLLQAQNKCAEQAARLKKKDQALMLLQLQLDKLHFDSINFINRIAQLETDCKEAQTANQQLLIRQAQEVKQYQDSIKGLEEARLADKAALSNKIKVISEEATKKQMEYDNKYNELKN